MTTSVIGDIWDGFATVVGGITGLTVYATPPDGQLEYPCLVVQPTSDIDYEVGALGANNMRFDLMAVLYVHVHDSREGFNEVAAYQSATGSKSIRAKVKTDPTLNGTCVYAEVVDVGEAAHDRDDNDRFWEFSCQITTNIIRNDA